MKIQLKVFRALLHWSWGLFFFIASRMYECHESTSVRELVDASFVIVLLFPLLAHEQDIFVFLRTRAKNISE
jgi:hypothetical protein